MNVTQDQIDSFARRLVAASAPSESAVFDEVLHETKKQRRKAGDPLGSGVGESWALAQFLTPVAIGIATWAAKDVLGKAVADVAVSKLKPLLNELFSKALKTAGQTNAVSSVSDEELRTLQTAIEQIARKHKASPEQIQQLLDGVRRLMRDD